MNAAAQKKYFTAEEANRRIPLVRAIVQDIVALYRDVSERRDRLERIRKRPGSATRDEQSLYGEEVQQIEEDLDKDVSRLQDFVDELQELGAELKDPRIGLIDFLTRIDGRDAYLCWKLGEDEIAYWHELDAGYAGRQSLLQGSLPAGDAETDGNDETT
jgi:hypothetical protein